MKRLSDIFIGACIRPGVVWGALALCGSCAGATLVWNADTNATGWAVEQWSGSNWTFYGATPTNGITITNTRTAYRVTATNDVSQSDPSVRPSAPANLRVSMTLQTAPEPTGPWSNSFVSVETEITEPQFLRARLDWRKDP